MSATKLASLVEKEGMVKNPEVKLMTVNRDVSICSEADV